MVKVGDFIQALDLIYIFRIEGEGTDAWKIANQTEVSTSEARPYETTPTKDGQKKTPGAYEGGHSLNALLTVGDPSINKIKNLVRKRKPEKLEVWEIDISDIGDNTENTSIPGEYSTDVVTGFDKTAGSEGNVEVSVETEVEGEIISGDVTVTPELLEILQLIKEEREFVQPTTSDE